MVVVDVHVYPDGASEKTVKAHVSEGRKRKGVCQREESYAGIPRASPLSME